MAIHPTYDIDDNFLIDKSDSSYAYYQNEFDENANETSKINKFPDLFNMGRLS